MKFLKILLVVLACVAVDGCRRTDIREMTVTFQLGATSEKEIGALKQKTAEVLKKYDGVQKDSFIWSSSPKAVLLTLKYDSMKIAQSNVRYALDEGGLKVVFPVKKDDRAGY